MNVRILTTISFVFLMLSAFSQDIILQRTGEELQVKVLEVNENNIKYKKFENLEGPTYTMDKALIFMVTYKNGSKEVFKTDSKPQKATKPPKVKSTFDFKANRRGGYLGFRIAGGANSKAINSQGYKASLEYANYFNSNIGFRTGISIDTYRYGNYTGPYYNGQYNNNQYYNDYNYRVGNVISVGMPVKLMATTSGRFGYYFEGGPTFYWYSSSLSTVKPFGEQFLRMELGMTHGIRYDINKNLTINGGLTYMVSQELFLGAQIGLMLKL